MGKPMGRRTPYVNLRSYEVTFIMPAALPEAEYQATEAKVTEWITNAGGTVTKSTHWGRRRLAYQIANNKEGYYIFLNVDMTPPSLGDFEYRLNIEPNILRHLVIRLDD